MRLTSKGRYAVRAMLDLARFSKGNPVRLMEISSRQNISLHYLEQLFRKLRNGNVVKSVRGPGGGYVLARPMEQISIKDILFAVGENINPAKDIVGTEAETSDTREYHLSREYFINLGTIMRDYLETTSLGDLVRRGQDINAKNREDFDGPAWERPRDENTSHENNAPGHNNNNPTNSSQPTNNDSTNLNRSYINNPFGDFNS